MVSSIAGLRAKLSQQTRSRDFANGDFRTTHACLDASCGSQFCPRCRYRVQSTCAKRWLTDFSSPSQTETFFLTALFDERRECQDPGEAADIALEACQTVLKIGKETGVAIRAVPEIKCVILPDGSRIFCPHLHGIGQADNEANGRAFDKALRDAFGKNRAVLIKSIDEAKGGVGRLGHYVNKGQTTWLRRNAEGKEFYDQAEPIDGRIISLFQERFTGVEVAYGNPISRLREIVVSKRTAAEHASSPFVESSSSRVRCRVETPGLYKQTALVEVVMSNTARLAREKMRIASICDAARSA